MKQLSLVVPAYNEEKRLPSTLDALVSYMQEHFNSFEIVVVNDGSTDNTLSVINGYADKYDFVVPVNLTVNEGKGAAIKNGVFKSSGEYILFIDADLSYALENIDKSYRYIKEKNDIVIGARDLFKKDSRHSYSIIRRLLSFSFNFLVETMLHLGIKDTQCGFKMFNAVVARQLFKHVSIKRFGFDVEVLFLAKKMNFKIFRFPIEMIPRENSSVSVIKDSFRMLKDIFRIKVNYIKGKYSDSL